MFVRLIRWKLARRSTPNSSPTRPCQAERSLCWLVARRNKIKLLRHSFRHDGKRCLRRSQVNSERSVSNKPLQPTRATEPFEQREPSRSARAADRRRYAAQSSSARQGKKRSVRHTRVIVTHYGGPDALRVVEEECPEPKNGEVRVSVLAAGVSLPDIMAREGVHPETPRCPSRRGGTWLAWWIGSATASLESNQASSLPRCRSRCVRGVHLPAAT